MFHYCCKFVLGLAILEGIQKALANISNIAL